MIRILSLSFFHKLIKAQISILNLLVSAVLLRCELLQFVSMQWHKHTVDRCLTLISIGSELYCWLAPACYQE